MTTEHRSPCPISSFLDLWGDRWTLIIIRDMLVGKRRFSDLEAGNEHVPPSILADRMKKLIALGVAERVQYQDKPPRYEYHLTAKGTALRPVLIAMGDWSEEHLPDRWHTPDWFRAGRHAPGRD
ncbi:transcriptional regulator, HxlR family [Yoonia tamlensis]|uniref:Transcriptional regulator, HxlR family n=1 Tax=Yoonia tamlensis TaxID=390270 RepID=A0A1I6FNQ6_9RHOB|nr:helix-turn-helix domain-containing protein [Yoonia tamlensis]SFR31581.1 transcriptional regulator, HxlR family [Yoonia tamlensis]